MSTATASIPPFYHVSPQGELTLNLHRGQRRAWRAKERIILVLSGTQSGKTSFGPFWLSREIQKRGPGDYLVVAPTFRLLSLKLFPEFLRLFKTTCKWGDFTGKGSFQSRFLFNSYGCRCLFGHVPSEPTQVFFGHAQDPDSLESATAKGIWLDEAGQKKFRLASWEAIIRRGSIHQARVLITTTPYGLGWLRDLVYEPWRKCLARTCRCKVKEPGHKHPYIRVVRFKSTENPAFPVEEYERTKTTMPAWKHRMFYDGEFERPAGTIYLDFDVNKHVIPWFPVPDDWPRYTGLDFGGIHTAGVFLAQGESPEDGKVRYHLYREYPPNGDWRAITAKGHVQELLKGEPIDPITQEVLKPKCYGGAGSEDIWRNEFTQAGLHVYEPPIKEVEVGIDRVIAAIRQDELRVFDSCYGIVDEFQTYGRELDDLGNPTEKIEDKEMYHRLDALRYIMTYLKGPRLQFWSR